MQRVLQGGVTTPRALPACTRAVAGAFVPVHSCADRSGGDPACRGDTSALRFDEAYHHVIVPPGCRYQLLTAAQVGECLAGRTLLLVGDSLTKAFYEDMVDMFTGANLTTARQCEPFLSDERAMRTNLPGGGVISYMRNHVPYWRGLPNMLDVAARRSYEKRFQDADVLVIGSMAHDLHAGLSRYRRSIDALIAWLLSVKTRRRPTLRIIWLTGSRARITPGEKIDLRAGLPKRIVHASGGGCFVPTWPNEDTSLVRVANAYAARAMRAAGIEVADVFALISAAWDWRWWVDDTHCHACYQHKPGVKAAVRAFGGGLSKMLTQALTNQICALPTPQLGTSEVQHGRRSS